jgi:hypothetical protein
MIKADKPAVLLLYLFAEMLVQHFPHCVQPNFKLLFNQALLYASAADIILLIRMIVNHRHEVALVAVARTPCQIPTVPVKSQKEEKSD